MASGVMRRRLCGPLLVLLGCVFAQAEGPVVPLPHGVPQGAPPLGAPGVLSVPVAQRTAEQYREHLQTLSLLVAQCQQHPDATHCRADAVGPDDAVTAPGVAGARTADYGWLRAVLAQAGDPLHLLHAGEAAALLSAAAARLRLEQAQAPVVKAETKAKAETEAVATAYAGERSALNAVLARAEFRRKDRSLVDRVLQAIFLWINRRLVRLAGYSATRRWLGLLLEWGLVGIAGCALAYWYVQQTRRARGLDLGGALPPGSAPAMRDWQRWREEAEQAAAQQRWRDAIHAYYWAAIARLESRGQWPVDRARTPREYLRLLAPGHPRRNELSSLTRALERCWYGSAAAQQPDCDAARLLFEQLVAS